MSIRKLSIRSRTLAPMFLKRRAGAFLAWWWEGLLLALPERWRAGLLPAPDIVTVEAQDGLLVFKLHNGADRRLREERTIPARDDSGQADINHWLENHENEIDLILLIPPDRQLDKHLTYPMASEKDLRAVLGHDMDRQTPFSGYQVYFDYTMTRKDWNSGKIHVHLHLVLRKTLHELLETLSFLTRKPNAATTDVDGCTAGINFIPEPERQINDTLDQRFKLTALLSIVLLIVALYMPLMRYGTITEQLENEVGENRTRAMHAQTLIDRKQTILARTNFLTNQDRHKILFTQMLDELTRCLPDDTWITQVIINEGKIQLRGEAQAAATVIRLSEQSDYFEKAEFRSPVIKIPGGQKEQFHVAARLAMR